MTISGKIWKRPQRVHPTWCDVARCNSPYAGTLGEHRSEPIRQQVPGLGPVVATLTQTPGRPVRVELTVSTAVPAVEPGAYDTRFVDLLVDELTRAFTRAKQQARAELNPSGPRPARAVTK